MTSVRRGAPQRGRRVSGAPARRGRRKRSLWFRLYMVLVVISAVIVTVYAGVRLATQPPPIPDAPVIQPTPGVEDTGTDQTDPNALVRRKGVYNFLLLGKDVKGSNTDTIIVVSYDTENDHVGMVSIPRDTAVNRSWSRNKKINAAYYGAGLDTLKAEIQQTFGIPIDYYFLIDLKGFIALVDELDGVEVYIPEDMNYDDPTPGEELHIHYTKGTHYLNGQQAMEVVRFRHNNDGSGYTDVGRSEMQRQVLLALTKKVMSWNSLTKVQSFVNLFQTYVKTDFPFENSGFFLAEALQLDFATDITQQTLPGRGDGVYGGSSWVYVFQAEDILPVLNEEVNPYTRDLTADDLDLPVATRYLQ